MGFSTQRVKQIRQGGSLFVWKGYVVVLAWKDKKPGNVWSTQSNPMVKETVRGPQCNGTVIKVPSIPVVKSYNHKMGGVDLSDQLHRYYMTGRNLKKMMSSVVSG